MGRDPPLDLFLLTPQDCQELMQHYTEDRSILGALMDLEHAIITGDEMARMEAISQLSDELVLKRGVGWA